MNPQSNPNWPLLGVIRFLLALTVTLCHVASFDRTNLLARLTTPVGGFGCVAAFLAISGFSIAHSIHNNPRGFYGRRIARIYPVYFACFILSFLPLALASPKDKFGSQLLAQAPNLHDIIATAFVLPSIMGNTMLSFLPSWSLGIEVVFYACAPLLAKLSRRAFAWVLAGAVCYHIVQASGWPVKQVPFLQNGIWPILSCAIWWLLGWFLYQQRKVQTGMPTLMLFAAIPGLYALNPHPYDYADSIIRGDAAPLVMTLTCVACVYGHQIELSRKVQSICTYLGDLSYPLYLVHMPLYFTLAVSGYISPLLLWLYPLAAIVGAAIVLHGVDYPFRALSRRRKSRDNATAICKAPAL